MAEAEEVSLYERIGGDAVIDGLVGEFYRRVLSDPALRPFFEGVSIEKLQRMQHEFFAEALDGPIRYSGRPLAEVHAGRGIEPRHLQRFLEHLLATLEHYELAQDDCYEMYGRIARRADEITATTGVDG
jgi:hemoglobin